MCSRDEETALETIGHKYVVGIDEVGRGCLAGPVTVCACWMKSTVNIPGINDSKKLSEKKREALYEQLISNLDVKFAVVHIDNTIIDQINILQATFRGMWESYQKLKAQIHVDYILIDGNQVPPQFKNGEVGVKTIVGGDAKCVSIAAASILAKVSRDRLMKAYDVTFPHYGFAQHKGYGAKTHFDAIKTHGPTNIHRRTFNGVIV